MPQLVLALDAPADGSWVAHGPLPSRVRSFGKYPNTDTWKPGDLLLVSSASPGWLQRAIKGAQVRGGYASDDARWHHAAVYIGDDYLCEADWGGVRCVEICNYVGTHELRLRRDSRLSPDEGWRVAINAVTHLRSTYNFGALLRLARQASKGFWKSSTPVLIGQSRAVICSQLYAEAYAWVTRRLLVNSGLLPVPAALSSAKDLEDVPVAWRRIAAPI